MIKCGFCKKVINGQPAYLNQKVYHSGCLVRMKNTRLDKKYKKSLFEGALKHLIIKHQEIGKEEDQFLGQTTLKKYDIYENAFSLAKRNGLKKTYKQFSDYFGVSEQSIKRTLGLKYASKETWKHIKKGRISAMRVAEIIYSKGRKHEKEIVEWVIQTGATKYETSNYRTGEERSMQMLSGEYSGLISQIKKISGAIYKTKSSMPEKLRIKLKPYLEDLKENLNEVLKDWELK